MSSIVSLTIFMSKTKVSMTSDRAAIRRTEIGSQIQTGHHFYRGTVYGLANDFDVCVSQLGVLLVG